MHIIGMVTRDSILRVIQTRSEVGAESVRGKYRAAASACFQSRSDAVLRPQRNRSQRLYRMPFD